jgi:hypothetical protein
MSETVTHANPPPVSRERPPSAAELVARVESTWRKRRRYRAIRAVLWISLVFLLFGGLFALADYLFLLGETQRLALWVVAGVLGVVLVARSWWKSRHAISRQDTVDRIETAFSELGQRVCTTVDYAEPTETTMSADPRLIEALAQDTRQRTYRLDFEQVIPWRRLVRLAISLGALAACFALVLAISPDARIATKRFFLLPAYYTQLEVEPGDCALLAQRDLKVTATISGRPVDEATLLYRKAASESEWTSVALGTRESDDAPLAGAFDATLKKCENDLEYRVVAGEVESETYRVTVDYPLVLKEITASIHPPKYTRRKDRDVNEGDFRVCEGSMVDLRIALDRPAQSAQIRFLPPKKRPKGYELPPPVPLEIAEAALTCSLGPITKNLAYEIDAEAPDGMRLEPHRFEIKVRPDRKPTIRFVQPKAELEVTPTTEVGLQVKAKDDYGLTKMGIVYQIGDGPEQTLWLDNDLREKPSFAIRETLFLEEHEIDFKDGVTYYAFVEDNNPKNPRRVTTDLRFIDIRPYKREYQLVKGGGT